MRKEYEGGYPHTTTVVKKGCPTTRPITVDGNNYYSYELLLSIFLFFFAQLLEQTRT